MSLGRSHAGCNVSIFFQGQIPELARKPLIYLLVSPHERRGAGWEAAWLPFYSSKSQKKLFVSTRISSGP